MKKLAQFMEEYDRTEVPATTDLVMGSTADPDLYSDEREQNIVNDRIAIVSDSLDELDRNTELGEQLLDEPGEISAEAFLSFIHYRSAILRTLRLPTKEKAAMESFFEGDYKYAIRIAVEENASIKEKFWNWVQSVMNWVRGVSGKKYILSLEAGAKNATELTKRVDALGANGSALAKLPGEKKEKQTKFFEPTNSDKFTMLSASEMILSSAKGFDPKTMAADINAFNDKAATAIEALGRNDAAAASKLSTELKELCAKAFTNAHTFLGETTKMTPEELQAAAKKGGAKDQVNPLSDGDITKMHPRGFRGFAGCIKGDNGNITVIKSGWVSFIDKENSPTPNPNMNIEPNSADDLKTILTNITTLKDTVLGKDEDIGKAKAKLRNIDKIVANMIKQSKTGKPAGSATPKPNASTEDETSDKPPTQAQANNPQNQQQQNNNNNQNNNQNNDANDNSAQSIKEATKEIERCVKLLLQLIPGYQQLWNGFLSYCVQAEQVLYQLTLEIVTATEKGGNNDQQQQNQQTDQNNTQSNDQQSNDQQQQADGGQVQQ